MALHDAVMGSDVVSVLRCPGPKGDVSLDVYEDVPTAALVPGDIIAIPAHGCTMQCDAALLSGTCIVNESMLTGQRPLPPSRRPSWNFRSPVVHSSYTTRSF